MRIYLPLPAAKAKELPAGGALTLRAGEIVWCPDEAGEEAEYEAQLDAVWAQALDTPEERVVLVSADTGVALSPVPGVGLPNIRSVTAAGNARIASYHLSELTGKEIEAAGEDPELLWYAPQEIALLRAALS
ncbi:hypothetical protein ACUH93_00455 [Dermabacteraceae bacterium P7006]